MKEYKLMIPGPGDVAEEVRAAMGRQVPPHYGRDWMDVYAETQAMLRSVFRTQSDVFIMPGPGSAAVEAAVGSLLGAGQTIVVCVNGMFGERLADIARSHALNVVQVEAPLGSPIDPDAVRAVLAETPNVGAVAVIHHETSTGVLNPIRAICELAGGRGVPTIVDAVSSLGGVPLEVDAWGIDLCISASNKCLEAPPGVAVVSISPHAWQLMDEVERPDAGWYLNLRTWRHYADIWGDWHPYPTTLPTNVILALQTSLRTILSRGLAAHQARYRRASTITRAGLRAMGFKMVVEDKDASPVITAAFTRDDVPVGDLTNALRDEYAILVGGGFGSLKPVAFRVGHLGLAATDAYLLEFLSAVERILRARGIPIAPGTCLAGFQ